MKKVTVLLSVLLLITGLGFAGSKRKYRKENDEKRIENWWDAKKYKTSKKYYRDHGNGVSSIQSVADSKAMLDAKANLAKQIKSAVATVEKSHVKDVDGKATSTFEQFTKQVAEQAFTNVKIVSQTTGKTKENTYDKHVVLQVSKSDIKKSIMSEIDKERLGLTKPEKDDIINKIDSDGSDNTEGDD